MKLTGVKLNENDIMIECSINVQNPPQEDILQLNPSKLDVLHIEGRKNQNLKLR